MPAIKHFAQVCREIGNEVADAGGFVAMGSLLDRFGADIIFRPLLVEGMLASQDEAKSEGSRRRQWVVLIDSDRYSERMAQVHQESAAAQLPERLRNTIAHELVHLLALSPGDFGLTGKDHTAGAAEERRLVAEIERDTELLSPFLLWPERSLQAMLNGRDAAISIEELASVRRKLGISRPVLVNRLKLFLAGDASGMRYRNGIRNMGVGMGEWLPDGTAVLRRWPKFVNFDRNIVPSALGTLTSDADIPAATVLDEPTFAFCGGPRNTIEFVSKCGTAADPETEEMRVHLSVETTSRRGSSTFLYAVKKA